MPTETLRPNGDHDVNISVAEGGDSHYVEVDESSPDGDTTRVSEVSAPGGETQLDYDSYNIEDSTASGTINSVKVVGRVRYETTEGECKMLVEVNGTIYSPASLTTVTSSYADYSNTWNTNPDTGSAWQWSEIDNLCAGVYLESNPGGPKTGGKTHCTQVYVEVDYSEAVGYTDSGLRIYNGSEYIKVGKRDSPTSDDVVYLYDGTEYIRPALVTPDDTDASCVYVWTGSSWRCLVKIT